MKKANGKSRHFIEQHSTQEVDREQTTNSGGKRLQIVVGVIIYNILLAVELS